MRLGKALATGIAAEQPSTHDEQAADHRAAAPEPPTEQRESTVPDRPVEAAAR
ncbi:hypothetical protein [Streptomyces sp. NPDC047123]|uniref:hypothetical protein n=1 Tax=Streptomyces sp. NPDC047123 TaxID=3155622 RepID=UPI0034116701